MRLGGWTRLGIVISALYGASITLLLRVATGHVSRHCSSSGFRFCQDDRSI